MAFIEATATQQDLRLRFNKKYRLSVAQGGGDLSMFHYNKLTNQYVEMNNSPVAAGDDVEIVNTSDSKLVRVASTGASTFFSFNTYY